MLELVQLVLTYNKICSVRIADVLSGVSVDVKSNCHQKRLIQLNNTKHSNT